MRKSTVIQLLSSPQCSLCDQAYSLLKGATEGSDSLFHLKVIDISGEPALKKNYGWRIPVLHVEASGEELDWPFDAAQCRQFLSAL